MGLIVGLLVVGVTVGLTVGLVVGTVVGAVVGGLNVGAVVGGRWRSQCTNPIVCMLRIPCKYHKSKSTKTDKQFSS